MNNIPSCQMIILNNYPWVADIYENLYRDANNINTQVVTIVLYFDVAS